ncbi:HlyD family efflux transporter periplasmic adaptor subunit [Alkalihalobacterium chitinilyticum]|uniref:HlyD family efflux transporter periplasmic adaptor subunit n=1 Tax=Alkalihalobacterium chitinilyticum TaxID=2980103 RepID=A0ABT5VEW8_9BACI|nr:HlyD family efflux transporter periplasmic adaptor subunit [Alkalihalobacterium chitinilyticum]MDE5414008.1 HlyD family efflux transporter periplasmic adaptor subunit [Alkalihalobacterium chitinilyticum]
MREVIKNINEISDSREVLESKPHPFVPIFISIFVLLLISLLLWSYIGEFDRVAKATGVVRPNDRVSTVQPTISGRVEEVHYQEGQQVTKGDILFTINQEELKMELQNRQLDLQQVKDEIELLKNYRESIERKENLFSSELGKEKDYSDLVEQYLLTVQTIKADYAGTINELDKHRKELSYSLQLVEVNMKDNQNNYKQVLKEYEFERQGLKKEIARIETELANEKKLKSSIEKKKLDLPESDQQRHSQFISFQTKYEKLLAVSSEHKRSYDNLKETEGISQEQINQAKTQYEVSLLEVETFINDTLFLVINRINELESQLQELTNKLLYLNDIQQVKVNNDAHVTQKDQLGDQQKNLVQQEQSLIEMKELALQKLEKDKIVEINSTLAGQENERDALEETIDQLTMAVENAEITAPISGTINVLKEMNVGEVIQPGESILSIIPQNESKYKMMIAVPNHEIGKIAVGNEVNFHFSAFPKQNYGHLKGEITSVSSDSTIQQDGLSYYTVEATIINEPLVNRKGEQGEVRIGMTSEVFVVTETTKVFHYLLEKINLRD